MAFSGAAFTAAAAIAAGSILKFEAENTLNDGPGALLEPNPGGAVDSVAQAIARQTCRRYADGVEGLDDDTSVSLEKVCRPYLDNIGYGQPPEVKLPFRGGQCPVAYRFTWQQRQGSTASGFSWSNNIITGYTGPLRVVDESTGSELCTGPGESFARQRLIGSGVNQDRLLSNGCSDIPPGWRLISLVRTDGQPDDCGSGVPLIDQPEPPDNPGPVTEPYNPNPGVDIDITVNLNPDSLVEVNLGFGPFVLPVFGGGGGAGGEPGTDPDTSPPAPEPGPELPGGNGGFGGDDGFGEPPAGRRWVGCCIRITNTPASASTIATSEPEDVYPSVVGNVRLVCNAAGNRFADTPVRILAKHVCVWEPVQKLNPTAVNVDLLPGYGYTFRPYSVPAGD